MKNRKQWLLLIAALLVGLLLGFLFFHDSPAKPEEKETAQAEESTTWTCSMHPQIRQDEPGQCPICGMDLIPVSEDKAAGQDPTAVRMSETAARLANIETMAVGAEDAAKTIRLNGKVVPNERLVKTQSSHISGRVEQLYVNTTGEQVRQGQRLALIYSPELISAQQELLQGVAIKESQPALYRAARAKLKALRISEKQIQEIEESGEVQENIAIYADRSGIVTKKMVNMGDYLEKGDAVFTIADLSRVWVEFDAYESDLPFLEVGHQITFSVASLPGKKFEGEVTFIDPIVDPQSRTAKLRVETPNPRGSLKPQMFATAEVEAQLGDGEQLVVPKTAVMWTGQRSVVYVQVPGAEQPSFVLREITLGPALGKAYIINEGLEAGERVVINGTFTVDAAAQLAGKPSMMNPEGGKAPVGHDHGAMESGGESMGTAGPEKNLEVSEDTKAQISETFQAYFDLKDALVTANESAAANAARKMEQKISAVKMDVMKEEVHDAWMHLVPRLQTHLEEINTKANIDAQRKAFVGLSQVIVEIANTFGPFEEPVYVLHCPMADQDRGADWLSTTEEVLNPYYGDLMLRCGEVIKEIK